MFSTLFIDISLIFVQLGLENFGKTGRDPPPFYYLCESTLFIRLIRQKMIISLVFPCASSKKKSPHLTFCYTFWRVCIFHDKFRQQIDYISWIYRNYLQDSPLIVLISINKPLITQAFFEISTQYTQSIYKVKQ